MPSFTVETLARVEGEAALRVSVRKGALADVKLQIYEPPRLFEGLLRSRSYLEVPDITARICGICPVAYQVSASNALEQALGLQVDPRATALRRLLYCGEWIESHALHIYMLHAPDFLGYESAIHMAKDHASLVQRGLAIKKAGNQVMTVVGGREIHPVNLRVGGVWRAPARTELEPLLDPLRRARDAAVETVGWVAGFEFPDFERNYDFVALRSAEGYAVEDGRIALSDGSEIEAAEYEAHFHEDQVPHSNALHSVHRGHGTYVVGPLARWAIGGGSITGEAAAAARMAGLESPCRNPFRVIVVRAVELLWACEEALRLIGSYEPPEPPFVEAAPHAGTGYGVSEAPRGLLYHRYHLDSGGLVTDVRIVPPTAQNLKSMEDDLWHFLPPLLAKPVPEISWKAEQLVRCYDPCISCATHFLKVEIDA